MTTDTNKATNHVLTVPSYTLRAMLEACPDRDIRYYLNGVYVDTERKALVATDGHCMFVCRTVMELAVPSFIIPIGAIETILKHTGKRPAEIAINIADAETDSEGELKHNRAISLSANGLTADASEVDGRFPQYMHVIPTAPSGEAGFFDPRLMMRMFTAIQTASDTVKGRIVPIVTRQNGPNGAALLVCSNPNLLAIVMPQHVGTEEECVAETDATLIALGFKQPPIEPSQSEETDVAIAA